MPVVTDIIDTQIGNSIDSGVQMTAAENIGTQLSRQVHRITPSARHSVVELTRNANYPQTMLWMIRSRPKNLNEDLNCRKHNGGRHWRAINGSLRSRLIKRVIVFAVPDAKNGSNSLAIGRSSLMTGRNTKKIVLISRVYNGPQRVAYAGYLVPEVAAHPSAYRDHASYQGLTICFVHYGGAMEAEYIIPPNSVTQGVPAATSRQPKKCSLDLFGGIRTTRPPGECGTSFGGPNEGRIWLGGGGNNGRGAAPDGRGVERRSTRSSSRRDGSPTPSQGSNRGVGQLGRTVPLTEACLPDLEPDDCSDGADSDVLTEDAVRNVPYLDRGTFLRNWLDEKKVRLDEDQVQWVNS
ncbi:hypothetical protein C8R44DRAFT_749268 [Mycena epipterygia]|nr:hypothetical protein C8R44DRAFT_749268 [Mycena epipterygia]